MKPSHIELHIEELVLHGFAPGDRYRIAAAVERELQRLFTEQSVPSFGTDGLEAARLDAGAFEVRPGAKAEVIGVQMAQAIYGGFMP